MAAILFPVFAKAREKARAASCLSNCKQIGIALCQYVQDNDERYAGYGFTPGPSGGWTRYSEIIQPYLKSMQTFKCPSDSSTYDLSYAVNHMGNGGSATSWSGSCSGIGYTAGANYGPHDWTGVAMAAVVSPAETIEIMERHGWWEFWSIGGHFDNQWFGVRPHNEARTVIYCDGHAKVVMRDQVKPHMLTVQADTTPAGWTPPAGNYGW